MNDHHILRLRLAPFLLVLSLLLGACAAPTPNGAAAPVAGDGAAPVTGEVTAPGQLELPGIDRPADGATSGGVTLDYSCNTSADCTVKNVGNCCGQYPACVNVDSPTDPEGVQAACAEKGMAGVCGFPSISSCQCVQGRCEGSSRALLE